MALFDQLAVIIPVGPGEEEWTHLIPDLKRLPPASEVLFVATREIKPEEEASLTPLAEAGRRVEWILSARGRARQLNRGAASTRKTFLWFLHADSRFSANSLAALAESARNNFRALHYFDLAFQNDGPRLTALNEAGAWIRSHLLGLPFGDQGFCIPRTVFYELGAFRQDVGYGEDHLFVWQARQHQVPLACTGAPIFTSARKYSEQGWLHTTLKHFLLTYRQAIPEFFRLVKSKKHQPCQLESRSS